MSSLSVKAVKFHNARASRLGVVAASKKSKHVDDVIFDSFYGRGVNNVKENNHRNNTF